MDSKVRLFDYGKSFVVTDNNKDNNPRFLIECKCSITDRGKTDEYYLGAPCKAEHTYSEVELFEKNSFIFVPLFHKDETLVFRKFKYFMPQELGEYKKKYGRGEIWGDRKFLIKETEGELLDTTEKIIRATQDGKPLMGRLVVAKGIKAVIDFPVKTMNTHENRWQADTGQIVFPEFYKYPTDKILSLSPAFIVFNSSNIAEVMTEGLVEFFGKQRINMVYDNAVFKIENPEIYIYAV